MASNAYGRRVVVTGLGVVTPIGHGVADFWGNLVAGHCGVAVLRESSVVFGAAVGWLVLHEPLGGRRLVSATVILVGLAGLVATSW